MHGKGGGRGSSELGAAQGAHLTRREETSELRPHLHCIAAHLDQLAQTGHHGSIQNGGHPATLPHTALVDRRWVKSPLPLVLGRIPLVLRSLCQQGIFCHWLSSLSVSTPISISMPGLRGQDAWRRHPIFKWKWYEALPGLREGAALFGVYLAADFAYGKMNPDHGHHGHGHEDAHGHASAAAKSTQKSH